MILRVQRKEILGTYVHTITATGTAGAIDHRQTVRIHPDRLEITDALTVAITQAAPGTALAAPGDLRRRKAGTHTFIMGPIARDVTTSGAGETRHYPRLVAHINTQIFGNHLLLLAVAYRAFARPYSSVNQRLGKRPASGVTAGTAIGVWQHFLNHINAQILFHVEFAICKDQHRGEQKRQPTNCQHCRQHYHVRKSPAIEFPEIGSQTIRKNLGCTRGRVKHWVPDTGASTDSLDQAQF